MKKTILALLTLAALVSSCDSDEPTAPAATFDSTPYNLQTGAFPTPDVPADNQLTNASVMLGRMLFYEKKLSKDGTQACADCHLQKDGFSDIRQFSLGVEGLPGKRQAMAVMNLLWHKNGLFWDGRAPTLRDQALRPIQDPLEMNETLGNVVAKLRAEKRYTDQFIRAFGDSLVTAARVGLALEQFMSTVISNNSKYDKFLRGEVALTASEMRGKELFFSEFNPVTQETGGECFHCHAGHNFTNNKYMNNGLDTDATMTDEGRKMVTNKANDRGKFKVPLLRNIEFTAPYMHDGRFSTLEQVLDHYNSGVQPSATVEFLLQYNMQPGGLKMTAQDKADVIAFLKTLSDTDFLNNPAYQKPE